MMAPTSDAEATRRARTDEVLDEALRMLVAHDMAGFAALWAPDGVLELPFASAGPTRVEGRAAVAAYLADYTSVVDVRAVTSERRHHTLDAGTVVIEFETDCVAVGTGAPFHMRYIAVVSVSPEGITSYRDYWSPAAAAEALGAETPLARGELAGGER